MKAFRCCCRAPSLLKYISSGQVSQACDSVHGRRHLNSMRHTRLPGPQRRVDPAAQGPAPAQGQDQLPVCPAQPHPHGAAGAHAVWQAEIHLQPKCGQLAPALRLVQSVQCSTLCSTWTSPPLPAAGKLRPCMPTHSHTHTSAGIPQTVTPCQSCMSADLPPHASSCCCCRCSQVPDSRAARQLLC